MRREWNDLLRNRRRSPEKQRRKDRERRIGSHSGRDERQYQHQELNHNEPPPLDEVPQRHEQEQSRRIANLRRRRHEPYDGAGKVPLHHTEHRLVVIDVGHRETRGNGHRKGESPPEGGRDGRRVAHLSPQNNEARAP